MSALGQKQTLEHDWIMSALPPKADMRSAGQGGGFDFSYRPRREPWRPSFLLMRHDFLFGGSHRLQ